MLSTSPLVEKTKQMQQQHGVYLFVLVELSRKQRIPFN